MNTNTLERERKGKLLKGNCLQCNEPFEQWYVSGVKKRYCDKKCADRASYERQKKKFKRVCKKCDKPFATANKSDGFCTMHCSNHYKTERICLGCKTRFMGTRRARFCSIECRKEMRVCPVCMKVFKEFRHSKTIHCSNDCHRETIQLYRSNCKVCGERFKGRKGRANKFCSRECYHVSLDNGGYVPHKNINSTTDYNSYKRARRYGVKREHVNVRRVFESNNWVCGICNGYVDKTIPYPNSDSASLDHIIPLSKGGAHTYDNVQLAHLGCNLKKNNN